MTPSQRELVRSSLERGLGWHSSLVLWQGSPRPVFVRGVPGDLTRIGFVELSIVSTVRVGDTDERRDTWAGDPPVRTRVLHKIRTVTIQVDAYSLAPEVEAFEIIEKVFTVLQSEATEAAHEAAQVSLISVGDYRPANFKADSGTFSRYIGEFSVNVAWDEADPTATPESIGQASVSVVREP